MGQCRQPELSVEAKVYESLDKVRFFVLFFFSFSLLPLLSFTEIC